MAPVPFALSPLGGCFSGSAGPITATGNQHARYFIQRVAHSDPNTFQQVTMRQAMKNVDEDWRLVTTERRAGWDEYARTVRIPRHTLCPGPGSLTGRMHYFRHNIPRKLYTDRTVGGPPNQLTTTAFAPVRLRYARGVFPQPPLQLFFDESDEWHQGTNAFLLVAITFPVPDTLTFYERTFFFRRSVTIGTASPASLLINTVIGTNQRVFCKCRAITSDGRTSKALHVQSFPP